MKFSGWQCRLVKLQRPPPEIKIFLPMRPARSSTATRRPRLPASMAQNRPAAPPPRMTTSNSCFTSVIFYEFCIHRRARRGRRGTSHQDFSPRTRRSLRNKSSRFFSANSAISVVKCLSVILRGLYSPPSTQSSRGTSHQDFLRELGDLCGEMRFCDPTSFVFTAKHAELQRNKPLEIFSANSAISAVKCFSVILDTYPQLEFGHYPSDSKSERKSAGGSHPSATISPERG